MFGTISHVKIKPGHEKDVEALDAEWMKTIRPTIDGPILRVTAKVHDDPTTTVQVFLCKDSAAYAKLSDSKEMDALFRRYMEHYEDEPTWEDVRDADVLQD
jgi:hypothetical protein